MDDTESNSLSKNINGISVV